MSQIVATTHNDGSNIMMADKFTVRDGIETRCKYSKIWKTRFFDSEMLIGTTGYRLHRAVIKSFFLAENDQTRGNPDFDTYTNLAAICVELQNYFKEHLDKRKMEGSEAIVILHNEVFIIDEYFGVSWQDEPIGVIGAGSMYIMGAFHMWQDSINPDYQIYSANLRTFMAPAMKYSGYVQPGYDNNFDCISQPKQETNHE